MEPTIAIEALTAAQPATAALKYVGMGLATLGMAGAAIGIGHLISAFFNGIARNPSAAPKLEKYFYIAVGLTEAMGIFAFLVAILIFIS